MQHWKKRKKKKVQQSKETACAWNEKSQTACCLFSINQMQDKSEPQASK